MEAAPPKPTMDDATHARIAANKAAALEKLAEKKRKAEERKRKAAEAAEPQCEPQLTDEPLMEDDCRLGFGKHAEKTASWVYENEKGYVRWVYCFVEEYWSQNMKNFAEYVEERENASMATRGTPHPYEGKRRSWMGGTADRTKKRTRRSGSEDSDDEDEDDARATKRTGFRQPCFGFPYPGSDDSDEDDEPESDYNGEEHDEDYDDLDDEEHIHMCAWHHDDHRQYD